MSGVYVLLSWASLWNVRGLERGARLGHSGGPYYCWASKRIKNLNQNFVE
jgi:hypothetical protein